MTERTLEKRRRSTLADTYLKDFVYGSIDGTVTTFAIVAGVVGAGLPASVILTLGFANLFADGFSMAASNFLGTRADRHAKEKNMRENGDLLPTPEEALESGQPVAWMAALTTFLAFVSIGLVPLMSFFINYLAPGAIENPFFWSAILTGFAFLLVGAVKGRVAPHHWTLSSLETLAVGGVAAAIAYYVGAFLQGHVVGG